GEILEAVADRSALEQVFHDVKEVHGVGQAQTRNYWTSVAVYHLNLWLHTLIELWAWHRSAKELVDRRRSPWDDKERRPSHADRRNALCDAIAWKKNIRRVQLKVRRREKSKTYGAAWPTSLHELRRS